MGGSAGGEGRAPQLPPRLRPSVGSQNGPHSCSPGSPFCTALPSFQPSGTPVGPGPEEASLLRALCSRLPCLRSHKACLSIGLETCLWVPGKLETCISMHRTEPTVRYASKELRGRKKRGKEGHKEEIQFLEDVRVMSRQPPRSPPSVVCVYLQAGHRPFQSGALAMPFHLLSALLCHPSICGSLSTLFPSVWGSRRATSPVAHPWPFASMTQESGHHWTATQNQIPRPDHCPSEARALLCSTALMDLAPQAAHCTWPVGEATGTQKRVWS